MLALLGLAPGSGLAQTVFPSQRLMAVLPDAPGYYPASSAQAAALSGTVLDTNGGVVAGATVTLQGGVPASRRVATSDSNGFFRLMGVPPGRYQLTIAANGFASSIRTDIQMQPGRDQDLARIELPLTPTTTNVQVQFSQHQLAAEQVHAQEKQRVLGILPNFYSSFVWDAAPMSAGQKFQLAYRSVTDPLTFVGAAGVAGIEQWANTYSGFGQGAAGYGKRLGGAYADLALSTTFSNALFPVLLHQDPRYFVKGSGSTTSRAIYALTRTVITRGDDGRSELNYSNVVGDFAAASVGNLYYPARDGGAGVTVTNAMISIGFSAIDGLFRELLAPDITTGSPTRGKP